MHLSVLQQVYNHLFAHSYMVLFNTNIFQTDLVDQSMGP